MTIPTQMSPRDLLLLAIRTALTPLRRRHIKRTIESYYRTLKQEAARQEESRRLCHWLSVELINLQSELKDLP